MNSFFYFTAIEYVENKRNLLENKINCTIKKNQCCSTADTTHKHTHEDIQIHIHIYICIFIRTYVYSIFITIWEVSKKQKKKKSTADSTE